MICLWSINGRRYRGIRGFPGSSDLKNLPATQETQVQSLGEEDPLEKGMATGTWQQVGDSMSHRLARKFLTLEGGV